MTEKASTKNSKSRTDGNHMVNSSSKSIFDKISKERRDTGSIKGDVSSNAQGKKKKL